MWQLSVDRFGGVEAAAPGFRAADARDHPYLRYLILLNLGAKMAADAFDGCCARSNVPTTAFLSNAAQS